MLLPLLACVLGAVAPTASATSYAITDLGTLGGSSSFATGVNDAGHIVGQANTAGDAEQHAFLYTGALPVLDLGGGAYSLPFDINQAGQIVGIFTFEAPFTTHGFFYDGSLPVQDLGTLTGVIGSTSTASGVNVHGHIVGSGQPSAGGFHAIFWPSPASSPADLGAPTGFVNSELFAINDNGLAAGTAFPAVGFRRAFRYDVPGGQWQSIGVFPGGNSSDGEDINEAGTVTGLATLANGLSHAFRWTGSGAPQDLGALPGFSESGGVGINEAGQIIGASWEGDTYHGTLWDGGSIVDVNDLLPAGSGWLIDDPVDINNAGQIVGGGFHNGDYHAFLLSPTTATPTGADVAVQPTDEASGESPVSVLFSSVTAAGTTTLTITPSGPPPPSGFALGSPAVYYELDTSAAFTGPVQVCIDYSGTVPALYHFENGAWVDVTTAVLAGKVCGTVGSFSPFAVFYPTTSNGAPTVDAGGPYTVGEGGTVTLSATGSDPDGDPLIYAWDLDGNGTFEASGQSVAFSAASIDGPASVATAVQATDSSGLAATSPTTVNVSNVPPSVGPIAAAAGPIVIGALFSASSPISDPAPADTHVATWSWGDGSSSGGTITAGSVTGSHAYTSVGERSIVLTVTDDDGGIGSANLTRTVIYKLCLLYDPAKVAKSGSTVPIKLRLCNAANANLSAPDIALHVQGGGDFRYQATLEGAPGYIYNISTKGLSSGSYSLEFTVGSEPAVYAAPFRVG
jgi:probable HAF family extracellular repeat protein